MNKFFFTFIFIGCSLVTLAQGETRIGIKAGLTSANITGADVKQLSTNGNPTNLQGFHFGIFINSKIKKHFWLKTEVLYIQKGATLQGTAQQSKFKSNYIDVYPFSPTFHWKGFQVFAGPHLGLLLNSSIQDTTVFGRPYVLTPYRQKLDAGYVLGAEYEFNFGISLGVRYVRGFMPLYEHPAALVSNAGKQPPPPQKIYNECLNFSIGYSFGGHTKAK